MSSRGISAITIGFSASHPLTLNPLGTRAVSTTNGMNGSTTYFSDSHMSCAHWL